MKRNLLYWTILVLIAALAGTILYTTYQENQPCAEPVRYSIGIVDQRFEISDAAVLKNAAAAAKIWNTAAGKVVAEYDPEAGLKINLVYDEREELTKLGIEIARQQETEDNVRTRLNAEQDRFTTLQNAYNTKVEAINARGGANPKEARELDAERAELSLFAGSLNAQVQNYNARVANRNAIIAEYNKNAGRTYEEGQYVRDNDGERINIFVYVDSTQLTRVLTHELGHAIGLDHNEDEDSIMYAKNESGNLKPSTTDLADLKALCGA